MFATMLMAAALSIAPAQATPAPRPGSAPSTAQPAPAAPPKLPVSLTRIRRQLARETRETERFENFRLISSLQVYGQAPRFDLFNPDEVPGVGGPSTAVRYGSVTHQEFLSQVTPKNFQAPVMNLSGGLFSLSNWIADRKREAQRRKETEERQQR